MIRSILNLTCLLTLTGTTAAQLLPTTPEDGFLEGATTPISVVFDQCSTDLKSGSISTLEEFTCSVVDSVALGPNGRSESWMLTYRRSAVLEHEDFVDSLDIDELVLIGRESGANFASLEWHLPAVRAYEFLRQVESISFGDTVFVSYLICLNGTGGCAQQFLLGSEEGWIVVKQPYLDGLLEETPEGWTMHKGRMLDIETMTGRQPIAAPDDPNCCPSGEIRFSVRLVEGALQLVSSSVELPTAGDWSIVAGERFGPVTPTMSERALIDTLPDGEVVRDSIGIGEGYCVPGTVLYPGSPNEVSIVWTDSTRTAPAYLRIWHRRDAQSDWKTSDGIYLGMPLTELVELNGAPFTLSGFGWDYGGSVGSMKGGRLAKTFESGLHLALVTDRDSLSALGDHDKLNEIFGDRPVRSDHPVVQRVGAYVVMISLRFAAADHSWEVYCG